MLLKIVRDYLFVGNVGIYRNCLPCMNFLTKPNLTYTDSVCMRVRQTCIYSEIVFIENSVRDGCNCRVIFARLYYYYGALQRMDYDPSKPQLGCKSTFVISFAAKIGIYVCNTRRRVNRSFRFSSRYIPRDTESVAKINNNNNNEIYVY